MTATRWAWTEIDLSAVAHNVRTLKSLTAPGTRFMAVVKADGYGHGSALVARAAIEAGATNIGVATVDEAVTLRLAGIAAPILLLSEPPRSSIELLLEHSITPTLYTREFAGALGSVAVARGAVHPFHLKVDTGMSRIGIKADDAAELAASLGDIEGIRLEGVFTHFATADVPGDWDVERQLKRFRRVVEELRDEGIAPEIVHCANSPATILYPEAHFDMVRCGIAIYGLHPSSHTRGRIDLRPAMSVKARASLVKPLGLGEGVSYGLSWHAPGMTTVATLPLGYADGVHRVLSNAMEVLVQGRRVPQVGRVCMDQLMVEVPRSINVERGEEFVIVGEQAGERITMDELAEKAGTINYELACALGMRLERVYV